MFNSLAKKLTTYSICKGWVSQNEAKWCHYALEKWISTACFWCLVFLLGVVADAIMESLVFSTVLFIFRQRLGGWHAKHAWSCQLFSIGTVAVAILLIGPILESMFNSFLMVLDGLVLFVLFIVKPIYPENVHFTRQESEANFKVKNKMLAFLAAIQILTWLHLSYIFTIYSFIALAITGLSVLLEYFLMEGTEQ